MGALVRSSCKFQSSHVWGLRGCPVGLPLLLGIWKGSAKLVSILVCFARMYWPNCGGGTFQSSRASPATRLQFQFSRAGLRFPFWHKFQFSPDAGAWWYHSTVLTILFPPQSSSFQSSRTVLCGWGCSFLVRSFSILTRAFPDAAVCQQFSFNPHALWQRVRRSWLGAPSTTRFNPHAAWAGAPAETGHTSTRFSTLTRSAVSPARFQSKAERRRFSPPFLRRGCSRFRPCSSGFNPHTLQGCSVLQRRQEYQWCISSLPLSARAQVS